MFPVKIRLSKPGLFVTGTDTGVGKTVITCAIAAALRRQGEPRPFRVGVSKPFASGCRREREGLVSDDTEALAHFADCRQPLDIISPIRFADPLAPAVAAEQAGEPIDYDALTRSFRLLDQSSDALLVEGVGGLLVPLDPAAPKVTVLDLAKALRYPVVIVTRPALGTLNHTAMTVRLLRAAGCPIAGLVINGFDADSARRGRIGDLTMTTNRTWLQKMNGVPVLATVPQCEADMIAAEKGRIAPAVFDAIASVYWPDVLGSPD